MDKDNGAANDERFVKVVLGPLDSPIVSFEGIGWMQLWSVGHLLIEMANGMHASARNRAATIPAKQGLVLADHLPGRGTPS